MLAQAANSTQAASGAKKIATRHIFSVLFMFKI
jgi:hypothetical protein